MHVDTSTDTVSVEKIWEGDAIHCNVTVLWGCGAELIAPIKLMLASLFIESCVEVVKLY